MSDNQEPSPLGDEPPIFDPEVLAGTVAVAKQHAEVFTGRGLAILEVVDPQYALARLIKGAASFGIDPQEFTTGLAWFQCVIDDQLRLRGGELPHITDELVKTLMTDRIDKMDAAYAQGGDNGPWPYMVVSQGTGRAVEVKEPELIAAMWEILEYYSRDPKVLCAQADGFVHAYELYTRARESERLGRLWAIEVDVERPDTKPPNG